MTMEKTEQRRKQSIRLAAASIQPAAASTRTKPNARR